MVDHISERRIERMLVDLVEREGGIALKLAPTISGIPDRLVILPGGKIWFVELKAPGKSLSATQDVMHKVLGRLEARVVVLDSPQAIARWASKVRHPAERKNHE